MEIPSQPNLPSSSVSAQDLGRSQLANKKQDLDSLAKQSENASPELKEAFEDFVGQTFFTEMIKAARTAQQKPAYFHGGRAEEVFQSQFDQMLSERMSEVSAETVAEPMLELFMLGRKS